VRVVNDKVLQAYARGVRQERARSIRAWVIQGIVLIVLTLVAVL
jgi:hypothetical protein